MYIESTFVSVDQGTTICDFEEFFVLRLALYFETSKANAKKIPQKIQKQVFVIIHELRENFFSTINDLGYSCY